jgi:catechol-2,3-dioxygenase
MTTRVLPDVDHAPVALSHVVLRTAHIDECIEFYGNVLGMKIVYRTAGGAAISHDGEHHRIALVKVEPGEKTRGAGLEHFAWKTQSLGHLLANNRRLSAMGIKPVMCLHHGGTLSAYYLDPDGLQVEVFIDTMPADVATEYMHSEAFAANPIGAPIDLDELTKRYESGEPIDQMLIQPILDEDALDDLMDMLIERMTGEPA